MISGCRISGICARHPVRSYQKPVMMEYLKQNLSRFTAQQDNLTITKIIFDKQVSLETEDIDQLISRENF